MRHDSAFGGPDGRNGPDGRCANPNDLMRDAGDRCYGELCLQFYQRAFLRVLSVQSVRSVQSVNPDRITRLRGRAYAFKSAIFGGHDKQEFAPDGPLVFFKGDLRKLGIRHY